jgi:carbamate kinase
MGKNAGRLLIITDIDAVMKKYCKNNQENQNFPPIKQKNSPDVQE